MIAFLSGTVLEKNGTEVVIETAGGVGYLVALTATHAAELQIGETTRILTHFRSTDHSMDLFGFRNSEERAFFSLLLSVSGIGPKSAMSILSLGSLADIQDALRRGDVAYLTSVSGMGKKTAERLVVELKSKIGDSGEKSNEAYGDVARDAIEGLASLGYTKEDARAAVSALSLEGKSVEEVLREALQGLK